MKLIMIIIIGQMEGEVIMIEKIIIFLIAAVTVGLLIKRFRDTLKGESSCCSGCSSNCNACDMMPIEIKEEDKK